MIEFITEDILHKFGACKTGIEFAKRNKLLPFSLKQVHDIEGDYNGYIDWLKTHLNDTKIEKLGDITKFMVGNAYRMYDKSNTLIESGIIGGGISKYNDKGDIISYTEDDNVVEYDYKYNSNGDISIMYRNGEIYNTYTYEDDKVIEIYNNSTNELISIEYDDIGRVLHKEYKTKIVDDNSSDVDYTSNKIKKYEYDGNRTRCIIIQMNKTIHTETVIDDKGNVIYFYTCVINNTTKKVTYSKQISSDIEYYDNGQLKRINDLRLRSMV